MHSVQCIQYLLWARKTVTRQRCNHEIKQYAAAVIRWGVNPYKLHVCMCICVLTCIYSCVHMIIL